MDRLYQGDNLEIMKAMEDETVDLIIADGPFYSQVDYGDFNDRWQSLEEYLDFMVKRLEIMRDLLKDSGSLYLHCDPSASHYLKVELDKIFGYNQFRNEIVWCYSPTGSAPKLAFHRKHDIILYYGKTENIGTFHRLYTEITEKTFRSFNLKDEDGRLFKTFLGKRLYLDECKGRAVPSYWTDIPSLGSSGNMKEKTGYQTQKPLKLYERIIEASSNPGDIVLDPFCGSGTTCVAAKRLNRRFIGIDKNEEAIKIAQDRLDKERQMRLF